MQFNDWISVKDQKPKDMRRMWVYDGKNIYVGRYDVDEDRFYNIEGSLTNCKFFNRDISGVTHWMPAPNAPNNTDNISLTMKAAIYHDTLEQMIRDFRGNQYIKELDEKLDLFELNTIEIIEQTLELEKTDIVELFKSMIKTLEYYADKDKWYPTNHDKIEKENCTEFFIKKQEIDHVVNGEEARKILKKIRGIYERL